MEVKTISSDVETKYKCKIEVSIADIDKEYITRDQKPFLDKCYEFKMPLKNGSNIKGQILFGDQVNSKGVIILFDECLTQDENFSIVYNFQVNDVSKEGTKCGTIFKFYDRRNDNFELIGRLIDLSDVERKIATFQGTIEIEFKPSYEFVKRQELKNLLHQDTFGSQTMDPDFTILCGGKEFKFNKSALCFISRVFKAMIENSNTLEATSGCVEIKDFSPETIAAFKNVVFTNDEILYREHLTVDLLMFGNKYAIDSLVKVVADHLKNNLTMENIYPVIESAYLIDDDELLKSCVKFVKANFGKFKDDEKWNQFQKMHPNCAVKTLNFMMMNDNC